MAGYRIGEKNRAKIEKNPQLRSLICLYCEYLSKDPTVLTCGHRFCRTCVESLRVSGSFVTVACPIDGHYVKLEECHQDKLAITQINNLVMSCEIKTCTWHGKVWHLEDHMKDFHNSHKEECAKNLHQDGELKRLRQEQQEAARKIMGMDEMLGNQDVTIHNIRRQLSAFSDAFVKVQGHGQLDNKGKSTGNVELRQQLSTLQHKVQTLEEQLRVQKDQCGKYYVECVAESGRTCEERNIEVETLQGSISCLKKQLVDVQNKYAALQTSHANLQHRLDALQAQFTFS
ncbi:TNF receptor-associated factor 5-like isoform X2 [Pocillopora verrucosa]|uniref:TNF receptor-associated factor 5-like isoform X2 n=1 Tax=Pocillopora verrucosa TaxID=203993 RepID=UPI003341EE76